MRLPPPRACELRKRQSWPAVDRRGVASTVLPVHSLRDSWRSHTHEYEVLNTLEQSWGGLCTHVREGWNIGKPPHGYRAKASRHPNPMKANKGLTKSRLEPDGACAETVAQIAHWRYHEGLGCATIAERLNADRAKHPPPTAPSKARTRGAWSKSNVYAILTSPKYTGYQVFNRRATSSQLVGVRLLPVRSWSA